MRETEKRNGSNVQMINSATCFSMIHDKYSGRSPIEVDADGENASWIENLQEASLISGGTC